MWVISTAQGRRSFFQLSWCEIWIHIFSINLSLHTLLRRLSLLQGKQTAPDKYGLPLFWASGLSCSARAEIQTKAIKASAIYTLPVQDRGIHSPSLEWDLHGDTDFRELGQLLSTAWVGIFSLQGRPLQATQRIFLQPRSYCEALEIILLRLLLY